MAKVETEQGISRRKFVVDGLIVLGLVATGKLSYPVFQEYWENAVSSPEEGPGLVPTPEPTVSPKSQLFFQEDFESLKGWNVSPRGGRVWADGWLNLEAPFGASYPVVEGREIFPLKGDFEFTTRVEFPEKTGYGVELALVDEEDNPVFHISGGFCANPYIRTALDNGEEINPFILYSNNGWDNSLSQPDAAHIFSLFFQDGTGFLSIDGSYIGRLSSLVRPTRVRMGNSLVTAEHGEWTKMKVDFLEVKQTLEPSFMIPEPPPFYNLVLFREIGGEEIRGISSLALPPGENWALEFESEFYNFSPNKEKYVSIRLGDLEILSGKGWKRFISLSAGKEGEKFGFLITPDVGKPVKGRESLYRPKESHLYRLVHLGAKEYLFVDGILVNQGPREEIRREIPVEISEEADGSRVKIKKITLFSVASAV